MYIPAFLPCPKCQSGPNLRRDFRGNPVAECNCKKILMTTWGDYRNDSFDEDEIKRLNVCWNEMILGIE